jgi:tRNA-dihydrouridine synthase B
MVLNSFQGPVLILAPLSGVTDFPFRQVVRKMGGASLVLSEMIVSQSMVYCAKAKKALHRPCPVGEDCGLQLAGNDPAIMAEAARMAQDLGVSLIDINMGCPAKKIAINSYAGAALMKDELRVSHIFEAVTKAVSIPVTVKMRKGWDESKLNAPRLMHLAKESGLAYATLHGRTRAQLFHGSADWPFIHALQASIDFPIIGNGDIDHEEMAAQNLPHCAGLMVGRGMYGRPWFLAQVRHFLTTGNKLPPPSLAEQQNLVEEHFDHMLSYYGIQQGIHMARKHLAWYSKGLPGSAEFRENVFHSLDPDAIRAWIRKLYKEAENVL